MIRRLLDTNICIALLRGENPQARAQLGRCSLDEVGLSAITFAELQYGVAKSSDPGRNAGAVADFCAALQILPFDDRAGEAYGRVRGDLERAGRPIGPLDTLIAAHALSLDVTLVTNNEREFSRVPDLKLANWVQG